MFYTHILDTVSKPNESFKRHCVFKLPLGDLLSEMFTTPISSVDCIYAALKKKTYIYKYSWEILFFLLINYSETARKTEIDRKWNELRKSKLSLHHCRSMKRVTLDITFIVQTIYNQHKCAAVYNQFLVHSMGLWSIFYDNRLHAKENMVGSICEPLRYLRHLALYGDFTKIRFFFISHPAYKPN